MSETNPPSGVAISGATLVWAIVALFAVTVAGCGVFAATLDDPIVPITALLGAFTALVAVLGQLFTVKSVQRQVGRIEDKVDAAAEDTRVVRKQTNGDLQRTIRETAYDSMQKALRDHLDDGEQPDL